MSSLIDELLAYVAFDAGDRARLVALHDVLAPAFADIAAAFYAAAGGNPRTTAILATWDRVGRLRASLIDWMSTGLRGPYDAAFAARRSRIGHRHVEIGLDAQYMVTAIGVVRRAYVARIYAAYPASEAVAIAAAADKLLDLELAIMLRHYQLDSEARLVAGERQRRLEQIEAMRTLTAGLAHEVRNPLNSAKLQLELALRRARRRDDDAPVVEPIERAGHELDRLTVLLDEFLAFARPPALDPHRHDVVAVLRDALRHAGPLAERRGARLQLAPGAAIYADIDAAKLRDVIDNLVSNALEAVPAGGEVFVAASAGDDDVTLRVTDNGPGIPADVLPRIYEPFFSTKESGTGLGMSVAHSLVALHGGAIEVASSPAGTSFVIRLPRHRS